MASEIVACDCTNCTHDLRTDCINMQCSCCSHGDAQEMVEHRD